MYLLPIVQKSMFMFCLGPFNNYMDKMKEGGSVFVQAQAQGIKTVHAENGGGGQKMAKFCPRS